MQPVIRPVRAGVVESRPPWRPFRPAFIAALAAIAAAFIAPFPAFAQPPETTPSGPGKPGIFSLSSGDVGISFRGVSLDVVNPSDGVTIVNMDTGLKPTLTLNLTSPARYFGDSPVGYILRYGLSFFSIDTQDTPVTMDQEDLGTGVDGFFLSFTPMLVLDSARMRGPEAAGARFGIGLGVGYLNASGDFIEFDTEAMYPYPQYRRGIDVSSLAYGAHVFAEYSLGRLVLGLHSGFFNASGGGYDYLVGDYSIDAGFRSRF